MSELTTKKLSGKHLSAKELLRNKGICSKAWTEWEQCALALPKTGAKQFEPNGSWLQNKQINNGLESRKFLLGIERVERSSQLASAEWLPEKKKARVTKKIGNEWCNFGLEVNANLYLLPEEALFLLETECLELTWEGMPLCVQQAWDILINSENSDCTLDEYRVYSQLTRLGYRLQRFCSEKSYRERASRSDETVPRKKVLVDPEHGLWMANKIVETPKLPPENPSKLEIDKDVKEIMEIMVTTLDGADENLPNPTLKDAGEKPEKPSERRGRVEIISEQTILSPIKIVQDTAALSDQQVSKWPGSRIQRNVKLLPKRNDILPSPSVTSETSQSQHEISESAQKRKHVASNGDTTDPKKSKHEVIELSDDEIEEIPRPMSRMEMLNCLPNIAGQTVITENISRRYIPRGIKTKVSYRYDSTRLRKMQETGRTNKNSNSETPRNGPINGSRNDYDDNRSSQRNAVVPYRQYSRFPSPNFTTLRHNCPNNFPYNPPRQFSSPFQQFALNPLLMNMRMSSDICMQQLSLPGPQNWQNQQMSQRNPQNHHMAVANRWASFQMNMLRNSAYLGSAMRNFFMQGNSYNANWNAMQMMQGNRPHGYLVRRGGWNSPRSRGGHQHYQPRHQTRAPIRDEADRSRRDSTNERLYYSSTFATVSGTSSWGELKQKWREAKTITIDDEDCGKDDADDNDNEIQVVDQMVQPLVNAKTRAQDFSEIFERLRIIKSAPERTMRRKKGEFKISYNVYSSTQHYKKANPGIPMFHLVVTRGKESDFLQPVELNRLQQDAKGAPIMFAHVSSTSIAYIQAGIVSLPNLI